MSYLGLIPARGGSKGIPHKNIALLAGRPLIAHTCEAARASRRLTRLIVSTDDEQIAAVARGCGVEVPFLRPAALAGDESPMIDVVRHALAWTDAEGAVFDAVVILQPTSPLRRAAHIDAVIEELERSGADTVVSVVAVPHQFLPLSLMALDDAGLLVPVSEGTPILRRQDKPALYARNGPVVLAVRTDTLRRGRLYGERVRPLFMERLESLDIDGPDDLALAEWLLKRGLDGDDVGRGSH
jgi:CMP-N,N'-diacetyllegionaminic acid synthase